jgi:hypothetical protein
MSVPTTKILAVLAVQCAPPLIIYWLLGARLRRQARDALPFLEAVPYLNAYLFLLVFLSWLLVFYGFVFRWVLRGIVTP